MGWIILAVLLISIALEVLVGRKRGIVMTGIRFGFTVLGTVVAALIAKGVTKKIIMFFAEKAGAEGSDLTEMGKSLLDKAAEKINLGNALGPHAAGFALSAAIPFVFVILFLIFKVITLLLFVIFKAIMKNKLTVSEGKMHVSKLTGAIAGGVIGLVCCAVALAPIMHSAKVLNEADGTEAVFTLLEQKAGISRDLSNTIQNGIESVAKSPAAYMMRFTGTEALSDALVFGVSKTTPADIGNYGSSTNYNLLKDLGEVITIAEPVMKVLDIVESKNFLKKENIEIISNAIDTILKTPLLDDSDKVALAQSGKSLVDNAVRDALGLSESAPSFIGEINDISALQKSLGSVIDVASTLSDIAGISRSTSGDPNTQPDPDDPLGLDNLDVNEILSHPETLDTLIENVFKLDAGPDMIASFVNKEVADAAGEEFKDVISPETLKAVGEDVVREAVDSILPLSSLIKSGTYTKDDVEKIDEKIDELANLKIISPEDVQALKDYFQPNK